MTLWDRRCRVRDIFVEDLNAYSKTYRTYISRPCVRKKKNSNSKVPRCARCIRMCIGGIQATSLSAGRPERHAHSVRIS